MVVQCGKAIHCVVVRVNKTSETICDIAFSKIPMIFTVQTIANTKDTIGDIVSTGTDAAGIAAGHVAGVIGA